MLLTAVGLAACDMEGRLLTLKRLEGGVEDVASKISGVKQGSADLPEIDEFLNRLGEMRVRRLKILDADLFSALKEKAVARGFEVIHEPELKLDVEKVLTSSGEVSLEEYRHLTGQVYLLLAREGVKAEVTRRDLHIVQAVRALDDLEKQRNQIYERVRDWYGIHFPEAADLIPDQIEYLKLAAQPLVREEVLAGRMQVPEVKRSSELIGLMERSMGSPITSADGEAIGRLARLGLEIDRLVRQMGDYIRGLVSMEAPNLTAVVGPILASRLVSLAGGIERLARMPASTIQMLGAEKALFRFFKTGRGAPKHGVIFQHPYVHSANRWQRGKIARALAAKISIAARIDYFTKEDRSAYLVKSLENRIEEIRRKYAEPPPQRTPPKISKRRRR